MWRYALYINYHFDQHDYPAFPLTFKWIHYTLRISLRTNK